MEERDKGRLLANLKSLPNELDHLVKDLPHEEMRWRPIPGKWSIAEIIVHLRDFEREVFLPQVRRSFYEENPVFDGWDDDKMAQERNYQWHDAHEVLSDFRAAREETVRFLDSAPLEFWGRVGIHPQRGLSTVEEQVVHKIRNHDTVQMINIKDILRIKMPW